MNGKVFARAIDKEALRELCVRYDIDYGIYNPHQGRDIYNFFLRVAFGIGEEMVDVGTWEAICDKEKEEITEDSIYGN